MLARALLLLLCSALLVGSASAQRQSSGTRLTIEGVPITGLAGTVTDVRQDAHTLVLFVTIDDGHTQAVRISPWRLDSVLAEEISSTDNQALSLRASLRPFFDGAITEVEVRRHETLVMYAVSGGRVPSGSSAQLPVSSAFGDEAGAEERGIVLADGRRLGLGGHGLEPPWCLDLLGVAFPTPPTPGIAQEAEGPRVDYILYRCHNAPSS